MGSNVVFLQQLVLEVLAILDPGRKAVRDPVKVPWKQVRAIGFATNSH
jgi:sporulation protein YlmC with PRC-barrel domain